MARNAFPQVRKLESPEALADHLASLGVDLAFDPEVVPAPDGPLAQPLAIGDRVAGNRFAVLPMEGWDGSAAGAATELVRRRWRRFGESGAKLIWGGEAVAVRADGRANPRQLVIDQATVGAFSGLRGELVAGHERVTGRSDDLVVGLQLTHSGRFARPRGEPAPRTAYRHPLLDQRVGADDASVLSDEELDDLVGAFVRAAQRAAHAGFHFVDVKHCHGYLGHELLSAHDRPGRYGGDFDGRTRFLRAVVDGITAEVPGMEVGVRVSVFDLVPFRPGPDGTGEPEASGDYRHAFGGDGTGTGIDLTEAHRFLDLCQDLGVVAVCVTAGSPYYCPHAQRPAYFPPSDGYQPPTDPLAEVARLLAATAELKTAHPALPIVGSGYSYLQEWLPHVAQRQLTDGHVDSVGVGRMVLSYPRLPLDVLAGRPLDRQHLCRTFSDCTTAPRNGVVSGCYPLDEHYKAMPERSVVTAAKREAGR